MTRCLLVTLIAIAHLAWPGKAFAGGRKYICNPALSVFCRNIHVGCAGVTRMRTSPFELAVHDGEARLYFRRTKTWMRGHITNDAGLLIHLPGGREWIRLYQDGRYSHRIYPDDIGAMSYGICETSD